MKAKYYIMILSILTIVTFSANGQYSDNSAYEGYQEGTVINNYYYDHDYYSPRIKRFHWYYTGFNYYSPVFTDVYWYNYTPSAGSLMIYSRRGIRYVYSVSMPLYYGLYPVHYSWYSPLIFNINIGYRFNDHYWYGPNYWYGHNYRYGHYSWYHNYGPDYQAYNYNNGNNINSRPDGNNGNFDDNTRNSGNSGNNNHSRSEGGNNGNFRDKPGSGRRYTAPVGPDPSVSPIKHSDLRSAPAGAQNRTPASASGYTGYGRSSSAVSRKTISSQRSYSSGSTIRTGTNGSATTRSATTRSATTRSANARSTTTRSSTTRSATTRSGMPGSGSSRNGSSRSVSSSKDRVRR